MKRILFLVLLLGIVTSAAAQRWTVWYGINYTNEIKNGPLNQWRIANGGVDYTIPVSRWDYTAGVGFNTKGSSHRVNYVQLEGNAGYRFIDTPYGFRVSALAGPFFGIRVADDRYDWVPNYDATNPTLFGWQAGVLMKFNFIALKIGYEQALTSFYNEQVTTETFYADGRRVFMTTRPQSLFIRLGFTF